MPFPVTPRVKYNRNPLEEVVCQLRFSRILRIDSEIPVQFQEKIRDVYPFLVEKSSITAQVNIEEGGFDKRQKPVYEFHSDDNQWRAVLTSEYIALTTYSYDNWEDYKSRINYLIEVFSSIYKPKFFTRIGLRYQDVICRSKLDILDQPWNELINDSLTSVFSQDLIENELIHEVNGRFIVSLSGIPEGLGHVQHGIVNKGTEQCYLIDSDLFLKKNVEIKDAEYMLESFNKKARHLFRWCIKETLHKSLEPIDFDLSQD